MHWSIYVTPVDRLVKMRVCTQGCTKSRTSKLKQRTPCARGENVLQRLKYLQCSTPRVQEPLVCFSSLINQRKESAKVLGKLIGCIQFFLLCPKNNVHCRRFSWWGLTSKRIIMGGVIDYMTASELLDSLDNDGIFVIVWLIRSCFADCCYNFYSCKAQKYLFSKVSIRVLL